MEWPFVYGHIATATGWTFAEIDRLTLWEANDLFTYWQDYPPTHVLVAAYLGLSRSRSRKSSRASSDFEELAQAIIAAGGSVKKKLPPLYKS
ncbi:MAG TPA: hypothetical protein VFP59_14035 [Candidatus Angelobacter sp.]|nr:hypothetical protein [Candidatus Angelobacter sp.]